jgi:hypothetical protein
VFIPHNQLLNEQNPQIGEDLIEVECHISDTSLFIDLLRKHDGVVFFTVWMDATSIHGVENIWYEEREWSLFRIKWIAELNIQLRLVQWSFIREAEVWCFGKARKLWKTGDYIKSKKNILHALRYLLVALQIVDHGKIIDFQCGKDYYEQVRHTFTILTITDHDTKAIHHLGRMGSKLSTHFRRFENNSKTKGRYQGHHNDPTNITFKIKYPTRHSIHTNTQSRLIIQILFIVNFSRSQLYKNMPRSTQVDIIRRKETTNLPIDYSKRM